jgi:nicotinic acid mononucleotide adenylyltransferase
MKTLNEFLLEAASSTVAVSFGRLNPPTIGHLKLMEALKRANPSDFRLYLSHTQDPKKNPLDYNTKLKFAREVLAPYGSHVIESNAKTILDVLTELYKEGVKHVIVVVGSDRVSEFETLVKKYNGTDHNLYNFDSIIVKSAGDRDPDSDDVSGMSASKMRAAVLDDDVDAFATGMPKGYNFEKLWDALKAAMQ